MTANESRVVTAHEISNNNVEHMQKEEIDMLGQKAHQRIATKYSWQYICDEYEKAWMYDRDN